jgi:hypothetical protein
MDDRITSAHSGGVSKRRIYNQHLPDLNNANQQHHQHKNAEAELDQGLATRITKPPHPQTRSQFNTLITVRMWMVVEGRNALNAPKLIPEKKGV